MGPTRHPAHWGTKKQFVGLASRGTNLTESTDALKRLLLPTSANVSAASLRRVNNAQKMGLLFVPNATRGRSFPKASALPLGRRASENAVSPSTRATATATTPTTTVAADTMEATAVRALSRVELSKLLTANSASARIPSTKAKAVNPNARFHSSSAMATATTRTTTVAANTMEATAAVTLSKKLTARSANARIRTTSRIPTVKEHAVRRSSRATATATTTTTTVAALSMAATVARSLSTVELSKQLTAKLAFARIPSTLLKVAQPAARFHSTSAMATATTRTTTVPADTIKATVAVALSKKLTARSANVRTRNSRRRSNQIRSF